MRWRKNGESDVTVDKNKDFSITGRQQFSVFH